MTHSQAVCSTADQSLFRVFGIHDALGGVIPHAYAAVEIAIEAGVNKNTPFPISA